MLGIGLPFTATKIVIKTKTVFVLGAGASKPYGFPTGKELAGMLWSLRTDAGNPIVENLRQSGFAQADINEFLKEFNRSRLVSIDAFLSKRIDYGNIGKYAIAATLSAHESEERCSPNSVDQSEDWYTALWQALTADLKDTRILSSNQVKFISFNYDRSLEHVLQQATESTFKLAPDAAFQLWSKMEICHVYGQLGKYEFPESNSCRAYGQVDAASLKLAAEGIKIIPESRHDGSMFDYVRNWFDWAERICFLGFGFDQLNCERLDLTRVLNFKNSLDKPLPTIYASTLGMRQAEQNVALKQIVGPHGWNPIEKSCLETLRNFGLLAG